MGEGSAKHRICDRRNYHEVIFHRVSVDLPYGNIRLLLLLDASLFKANAPRVDVSYRGAWRTRTDRATQVELYLHSNQ